jgi:deoxyadenosine/deoxycytidine kinase
MTAETEVKLKVAVVGACASGKSALVAALRQAGYEARHVAQEHSYVPYMWQRISQPDVLVYLDVDYQSIKIRRPRLNFKPEHLAEQNRRLSHARQSCHLYLDTGELSLEAVRDQTLSFLREFRPAS